MKWISLALFCLFSFGSIEAFDYEDSRAEMFHDDDDMLGLEIEALLDDGILDESEINEQLGMEDYDQLDEFSDPTSEKKAAPLPIQNQIQKMDIQEIKTESLAVEIDKMVAADEKMVISPAASLETIKEETSKSIQAIEINLRQVFSGSPVIYSLLFALSTISVCVWLYSLLTVRSVEFLPPTLIKDLKTKLISNQFDEALDLCVKQKHFFCKMLASGILARKHGLNTMVDTMKAEGKRSTIAFWQRISILNEIAIIAPMLGLLGTVLGMFYAFYDLNRSIESVSLLFDGLGISVGTTVAGLIVAILAMILYSVSKYRLVRIMATVENEAQIFAALIDTRSPSYLEK
ncbi:MAG: hypothetical protein K1000chlam2_01027 [Chlamydiae bacterium]|nr:hypothetical protein [Chlamydiota bacterium]